MNRIAIALFAAVLGAAQQPIPNAHWVPRYVSDNGMINNSFTLDGEFVGPDPGFVDALGKPLHKPTLYVSCMGKRGALNTAVEMTGTTREDGRHQISMRLDGRQGAVWASSYMGGIGLDHTALNQILAAHEMVVSFAGIATPYGDGAFHDPESG